MTKGRELPVNSKVKRRLFSEDTPDKASGGNENDHLSGITKRQYADQNLYNETVIKGMKWNFDFKNETAMDGPIKWYKKTNTKTNIEWIGMQPTSRPIYMRDIMNQTEYKSTNADERFKEQIQTGLNELERRISTTRIKPLDFAITVGLHDNFFNEIMAVESPILRMPMLIAFNAGLAGPVDSPGAGAWNREGPGLDSRPPNELDQSANSLNGHILTQLNELESRISTTSIRPLDFAITMGEHDNFVNEINVEETPSQLVIDLLEHFGYKAGRSGSVYSPGAGALNCQGYRPGLDSRPNGLDQLHAEGSSTTAPELCPDSIISSLELEEIIVAGNILKDHMNRKRKATELKAKKGKTGIEAKKTNDVSNNVVTENDNMSEEMDIDKIIETVEDGNQNDDESLAKKSFENLKISDSMNTEEKQDFV